MPERTTVTLQLDPSQVRRLTVQLGLIPGLNPDGDLPMIELGTSAPATTDGTVLWYKTDTVSPGTDIKERDLFYYDVDRSAWLSLWTGSWVFAWSAATSGEGVALDIPGIGATTTTKGYPVADQSVNGWLMMVGDSWMRDPGGDAGVRVQAVQGAAGTAFIDRNFSSGDDEYVDQIMGRSIELDGGSGPIWARTSLSQGGTPDYGSYGRWEIFYKRRGA